MAKKGFTEEQLQEIKMLRANNQMLENTKQELIAKNASKVAIKQVEVAQDEVKEHLKSLGDDGMQLEKHKSKAPKQRDLFEAQDASIFEMLQDAKKEREAVEKASEDLEKEETEPLDKFETVIASDTMYNTSEPTVQYDVIPLPSHGQGYANKVDRVPVAYLTAYDENLITSPNLYRDGLIIDFLLKSKVVNKDIDVDELLSGDADAIILFLRATSYGPDFPIIVNDPDSGEQIETSVDLTKLKPKEFNLVGDENGWFEYETKTSKDKIKFRYLTRRQEKQLKRITELEGYGTKSMLIADLAKDIKDAMLVDDVITEQESRDIKKALKSLGDWSKRLKEKNDSSFNKLITNNLMMQVMSVNGETDKAFIRNYINNMPAMDSLMLRRYINDNTPGIDFEIEVERPESLGGGSFKTFLNWDDSVFLNISYV